MRFSLSRWTYVIFSLLLLTVSYQSPSPALAIGNRPATSIYFSPHGGCTEAVVKVIGGARKSILVQAYSFTSAPIAKALTDAAKRDVRVEAILDKSDKTAQYSSADFLLHANIPTLIDSEHAIAHNKVMIIDDQTVITGSFNFTKAAEESNAGNLLVIHDKDLAAKCTEN